MDEIRAREILGESIMSDGGLYDGFQYTEWTPGDAEVVLDGRFNLEELEAIVWWMRKHAVKASGSPPISVRGDQ